MFEENKSNNEICEEIAENKREKSLELFENSEKKLFSPKIQGFPPKYFHKIKTRSLVIDKSLQKSGNFRYFTKEKRKKAQKQRNSKNCSQDFTRKNIESVKNKENRSNSKPKREKNRFFQGSIAKKLDNLLQSRAVNVNFKEERLQKKEILDFYLSLLRKIELLRFSINFLEFNEKKPDNCANFPYSIEIDSVKIDNFDEKQCFSSICAKYGKDYFSNC